MKFMKNSVQENFFNEAGSHLHLHSICKSSEKLVNPYFAMEIKTFTFPYYENFEVINYFCKAFVEHVL